MEKADMAWKRQIISLLVENKAGVLARVAGLFSARALNIDSFASTETDDPTTSRMTIALHCDDQLMEQIRKQLDKLVNVIKVQTVSHDGYVERDLMLVKVDAPASKRGEICDLVEVFRGKVVDIGERHLVIEVTGQPSKVDALIGVLRPYGIKELVRSGRVAIKRGPK
jgi:acetolactate synthase-1/3 small subunit